MIVRHDGLPVSLSILLALCLALAMMVLEGCNASTAQKLGEASAAFAHGLQTFQQGEQLAVTAGKISVSEDQQIQTILVQVSKSGMALDAAIRANESNPSVSAQLNNVITAINMLIQQGVGGIKDVQTKQDLQVALVGAEAAISVVASVVGSKAPPKGSTTTVISQLNWNNRSVWACSPDCLVVEVRP